MGNKKLKCYLASGWFTESTREIRENLEKLLSEREDIDLYSPLRDGIMLPPNQKHDTELRESIFKENISNITDADLIVANIYSGDSYNDPGTIWEVGYAMANDIPVVGFTTDLDNIVDRFNGILEGICLCEGYGNLISLLDDIVPKLSKSKKTDKLLFIGNGDKEKDERLVSYIMDSGASIRWISDNHKDIYGRIDEIFENVEYVLVVVDDRKTLPSWMIGQAYSRGIPVITYSNYNYGINVMLLCSVLTHIRGMDELGNFLQQVKRQGIKSIPKFDISQLDSM